MHVWLNNRLVDAKSARVPVFDHGFLYGDGIYETVHAYRGRIFRWPLHHQRLRNSARRIRLSVPWTSAGLLKSVQSVLRANRLTDSSVRITISRGPGPLGLDPALCPEPTLVILPHPHRAVRPLQEKGVSIGIVTVRRNPPECLDPQIKSNNSLNTILAKMETKRLGVFEGVLLNLKGYLTEGTTSNVFFVTNKRLYTPSLDCGLLAGVTRQTVIELARREGIAIREGRCTPKDLLRADESFLSSTTLEIVPVVSAVTHRRHRIGTGRPGPLTRRLQTLFRRYVQQTLK